MYTEPDKQRTTVTPRLISTPATGTALTLTLMDPAHARRAFAETFVGAIFRRAYGATLTAFYPLLLGLTRDDGEYAAVAGIRPAGAEALFSEHYLDRPVEQLLTTGRAGIAEIGNLAPANAGQARWLICTLSAFLMGAGFTHVIFTSVPKLRNAFVRMGLPLTGLLSWFVVGYGLAPLRRLAIHLRDKRADDLGPLPFEEQPRELLQVVTSINDLLRRLDASFRREKSFAADAAHELRTPLSAMKIHLHNLALDLPSGNHNLQQLESATTPQNVVEQVLALHCTAPDEIMVRFEPIDLHALAQDYIARKYSRFEERNQLLELEGERACVAGDRFALETLLQNLLDNACKYTPAGGMIRVSVQERDEHAILQVQDSGPGIPADQHDRIFDRFYRGVVISTLPAPLVADWACLSSDTSRTCTMPALLSVSEFAGGLSVSVSFHACTNETRGSAGSCTGRVA